VNHAGGRAPMSTGILGAGLTCNRAYLLEGTPGSGKTTIALQFLLEGASKGEKGLYITLSETASKQVGKGTGLG
jgi:KaiC/GvpD/RAD55 family RecA-like ATPase